ncbi:hypothetical protein FIBSPDRAFT_964287 [Athelia psychrophila]|uniref:3-oxo-5-alpha-steroid 4-dehydrogenase C-terminal domain-containing protein n=1 Tax=Athelia psychrophila TaxID=1759441 RepID=A0A165XYW2_9AGAM|nr:hypothetical protein FIBSPDRAFT_964287 [Fibularhizoctonia sp. CBS 109695]
MAPSPSRQLARPPPPPRPAVHLPDPGKAYAGVTAGDVKAALAAEYPKVCQVQYLKGNITTDALILLDSFMWTYQGHAEALRDRFQSRTRERREAERRVRPERREVLVKVLGPQIGWKTVFLIEYVRMPQLLITRCADTAAFACTGWIVVHSPCVLSSAKAFLRPGRAGSQLQKFVYAFVMLHFVKRELETLFVHRFSHGTHDAIYQRIQKFGALPSRLRARHRRCRLEPHLRRGLVLTIRENPNFLWASAYVWIGFDGSFSVSFPNYFFELIGWAVIAGITGSWVASAFAVVAGGQMAVWAAKKHAKYKKEFGKEYPRNRKIMIPFIF